MAGYNPYEYGSQKSYLSNEPMVYPQAGGAVSEGAASSVGTGAAQGAMMGGPAGAAIGAGGSFLSSYLAQQAADERAKRDRAAQIEQQYAQNQNQGFDTLMNTYRGALR